MATHRQTVQISGRAHPVRTSTENGTNDSTEVTVDNSTIGMITANTDEQVSQALVQDTASSWAEVLTTTGLQVISPNGYVADSDSVITTFPSTTTGTWIDMSPTYTQDDRIRYRRYRRYGNYETVWTTWTSFPPFPPEHVQYPENMETAEEAEREWYE